MLKGIKKSCAIVRSPVGQPWLVIGGSGEYVRQEVTVMGWREMVGEVEGVGQTIVDVIPFQGCHSRSDSDREFMLLHRI